MMHDDSKEGILLISTFPDEESLNNLSKIVVLEKRICACVNYTLIKSIYEWKSNYHKEDELLAFFKTTGDHVDQLKSEIRNNHPYDIPEIVIIKMNDVSQDYLQWMYNNTH
ncbi:MAG TPA: divalent-cation tolerance protein CutA [Candidatus Nitrosocosmicus sp.]